MYANMNLEWIWYLSLDFSMHPNAIKGQLVSSMANQTTRLCRPTPHEMNTSNRKISTNSVNAYAKSQICSFQTLLLDWDSHLKMHSYPHGAMLTQYMLWPCACQRQQLSKWPNVLSWFLASRLPSVYPKLCWKGIQTSSKIRALPSKNLSQTLNVSRFLFLPLHVDRWKRCQVYLTDDNSQFITLSIQHHLQQYWHGAAIHVGSSETAETCSSVSKWHHTHLPQTGCKHAHCWAHHWLRKFCVLITHN